MGSIKRKECLYGITSPSCLQLLSSKALTTRTHLHLQSFLSTGTLSALPSRGTCCSLALLALEAPLKFIQENTLRWQKRIFQAREAFQSTDTAWPRIMYIRAHMGQTDRASGAVSLLQLWTTPGDPAEKSSFSGLRCCPIHIPPAFPFYTLPPSHCHSWHSHQHPVVTERAWCTSLDREWRLLVQMKDINPKDTSRLLFKSCY